MPLQYWLVGFRRRYRTSTAVQLTSGFHGRKTICLDWVYYISNEHAVMQTSGYVLSVALNCSLNCVFKQDLLSTLTLMCAIKNVFTVCTHFNMLEAEMEAFNPNNNV